jgi:acid phosphatase
MHSERKRRLAFFLSALWIAQLGAPIAYADDDQGNDGKHKTSTPIKHVIVIIGENRTFDNVYGTYQPKPGQTVSNLLSKGIVDKFGAPGANKDLARQFKINYPLPTPTPTGPPSYFIGSKGLSKTAYSPNLPTPEAGFAPPLPVTHSQLNKDPVDSAPPFDANTFSTADLHNISGALRITDLPLLTTGATGLTNCQPDLTLPPAACQEPDKRITNYNSLPNTSFQITGVNVPYDSYTGDMVHRFYHMWQQSDCDSSDITPANPTGCKNDLYPFIGIARGDDSGSNSMGFYNVQDGDAPLFKRLADQYTTSDNYHQPVMGGTAVQHIMLGTADAIPWETYTNLHGDTLTKPPDAQVANPDPKSATDVSFKVDRRWTGCDSTQKGFQAIESYLMSLPWRPDLSKSSCVAGQFYMINNTRPGFLSNGKINDAGITAGSAVPPSTLRTIGDALNEIKASWAFYGGGYNHAVAFDNGSTDPIDVLIGTGGDWYCDICNPFQYAKSIMGNAAQRQAHIKDLTDFFNDLDNGRLKAVSYLKPDSFDDGHPASSKLNILEALIDRIVNSVKQNDDLFESTAIFVTFDEGGGYWDSGFFQPIDFFGDGPRIPLIAVSKYSRGGKISHQYADHASIVKFIERNWGLNPLTGRSRDNLPNPNQAPGSYVPTNMPAVSDLFDLFDFSNHGDNGDNNDND